MIGGADAALICDDGGSVPAPEVSGWPWLTSAVLWWVTVLTASPLLVVS